MFKKLWKRMTCEHEYFWIGSFRHWEGHKYNNYIVSYCPKCGKEKHELEVDFNMRMKKQKIREDYRRRNGE